MKRWSNAQSADVESRRIDAFIAAIHAVCREHGLSISHEDGHGAFIIAPLDEYNLDWLAAAHVDKDVDLESR